MVHKTILGASQALHLSKFSYKFACEEDHGFLKIKKQWETKKGEENDYSTVTPYLSYQDQLIINFHMQFLYSYLHSIIES